jgi:hypothetical protein
MDTLKAHKYWESFYSVRKPQRFDKTKSAEKGYMEIYANNMFTRVNIDHNINTMKNFQGFCACNELPSGRFAKLQGGYYVLNDDSEWELVGMSLDSIPFRTIYNKLKSFKKK